MVFSSLAPGAAPVHPLLPLAMAGRNYAGGDDRPTSMRALCSCRVALSRWVMHDRLVIGGVDDRLVSFIPANAEVGMLRAAEHLPDFVHAAEDARRRP